MVGLDDGSREEREFAAPLVNVRLIEGIFAPEQGCELIRQLTETMVNIEGENLRPVTRVVIDEVKSGDWRIGGNTIRTAVVLRRRARSGSQSRVEVHRR